MVKIWNYINHEHIPPLDWTFTQFRDEFTNKNDEIELHFKILNKKITRTINPTNLQTQIQT